MGGVGRQRNERLLAEMLDVLPDRVSRYRVDDRTIVYCNRVWAAGHGATPDEMVGRSLDDLLSPSELDGLRAQLARLGPDTPLLPDVTPRTAPEAPTRWILWIDKLLPGPDGDEVLSVGRDVTERHLTEARLRESEQRFRLAMVDSPIGMAIIGVDGTLLEVNEALCELVGRAEEELVGLGLPDITHPEDVDASLRDVERVASGELASFSAETRFLHADGSVGWTLLSVSPVRDDDGQPIYLIGQVVDITDRVERERMLRQAADVEHATAERLRELDEVQNAFLTAVSHELRTPLTVVQGMAATLQRLRASLDAPTRDQLEDAIGEHADRLSELLEDLLDVDRLARGELRAYPADFDVAEHVREVTARSSVADRLALVVPDRLEATADPVQVERIVANLLENAAKYAPEGSVTVRLGPLPAGGFRLEVLDEGPGIPSEELTRVFEPFHRLDDVHPQPGTGVGLALVARFASIHGGRAWAEDRAQGAHLVVEIPEPTADRPTPGVPAL